MRTGAERWVDVILERRDSHLERDLVAHALRECLRLRAADERHARLFSGGPVVTRLRGRRCYSLLALRLSGPLVALPLALVARARLEVDCPVAALAWLRDFPWHLAEHLVEGKVVADGVL